MSTKSWRSEGGRIQLVFLHKSGSIRVFSDLLPLSELEEFESAVLDALNEKDVSLRFGETKLKLTAMGTAGMVCFNIYVRDSSERFASIGIGYKSFAKNKLWPELIEDFKFDLIQLTPPPPPWAAIRIEPASRQFANSERWLADLAMRLGLAWMSVMLQRRLPSQLAAAAEQNPHD